MKYWTDKHLEHVRSLLPTDVTAEFNEITELEEGDNFCIIVRRYGASVCLELSRSDRIAVEAQMPVYIVEEDRYEPRWRENFGMFDNAIRRCIELVRNPDMIQELVNKGR